MAPFDLPTADILRRAWITCDQGRPKGNSTAYYRYDYAHDVKNLLVDTFMDKAEETFGWQRDVNGDLWHFVGNDFYTIAEGEKDYSVDFHKIHEIPEQDENHFIARHVATRALVNKKTKKVERVFQCEALNVCTFSKENAIRTKSSIKEFDDKGQPVSLQKGISYETRVRTFAPWNQYKGRNMRKLFIEYLTLHGLTHLAPRELHDN